MNFSQFSHVNETGRFALLKMTQNKSRFCWKDEKYQIDTIQRESITPGPMNQHCADAGRAHSRVTGTQWVVVVVPAQ